MLHVSSKARIITFMGPVGVGKSTQMRLLKGYLKSKNIRVIETFIKSSHVFAYILSRSLRALGVCEKVSYTKGLTRIYPRRDILRRLFPLWCLLDALSIAIKFFLTVYIPFCLGYTILIEEGLTMMLYTYNMSFPCLFKIEPKVPPFLPRLLGWVLSKNHVNVVLEAKNEELSRRRKHRSYRQNELSLYISLQRKWIARLSFGDTIFVDTTNEPPVRVHKKIIMALEKHTLRKH